MNPQESLAFTVTTIASSLGQNIRLLITKTLLLRSSFPKGLWYEGNGVSADLQKSLTAETQLSGWPVIDHMAQTKRFTQDGVVVVESVNIHGSRPIGRLRKESRG
jgi:hypothetical protein